MREIKRICFLGLVVFCGYSVFDLENSNSRTTRFRKRATSMKLSTPKPVAEEVVYEAPKVDEVQKIIGIPSSAITIDNCELFYSMCMNKYCIQDDDKAACSCSSGGGFMAGKYSLGEFVETSEGDLIKEGIELMDYSKGFCKTIAKHCPGMELALENSYDLTASSDCVGWAVKNPEVEPTIYDEVQNLKECMKPVCAGGGGLPSDIPYVKCFNTEEAEILLNQCSSVIARSAANLAIKEYFLQEMKLKMQEHCKNLNFASSADDLYSCNVRVSYGVSPEKPIKDMVFKMGDSIMCSQEYFGTETPVIKSIAKENAKKMKRRSTANMIDSGVGVVTSVVNVVSPGGDAVGDTTGKVADFALKNADKLEKIEDIAGTVGKVQKYAGIAAGTISSAAAMTGDENLQKISNVANAATSVSGAIASMESAQHRNTRLADDAVKNARAENPELTDDEVKEIIGKYIATKTESVKVASTDSSDPDSMSLPKTKRQVRKDERADKKAAKGGSSLGAMGAVGVVGDVLGGVGDTMAAAADMKMYAAQEKLSLEVRAKGSCWINGLRVAGEGEILNLMWTEF